MQSKKSPVKNEHLSSTPSNTDKFSRSPQVSLEKPPRSSRSMKSAAITPRLKSPKSPTPTDVMPSKAERQSPQVTEPAKPCDKQSSPDYVDSVFSPNREVTVSALPMQTRSLRLSSGPPTDENIRPLPPVNCREKIVFCVDISEEMSKTTFTSKTGEKETQISVFLKTLKMFLFTKQSLNPRHEYALMVLTERAYWMCDFKNDIREIIVNIEAISHFPEASQCNLATIFEELEPNVELYGRGEESNQVIDMKGLYTVRVILVYGRSHCIPTIDSIQSNSDMMKCPYFTFDVLYLHEPVDSSNETEKIFGVLCDLDPQQRMYILEASKNITKVYDCMAKLIAHPLQRPLEKDANYVLNAATEILSAGV